MFRILGQALRYLIVKALTFMIIGLRPLLGPIECRYTLSCTRYAVQQLEKNSILVALLNIAKRLLSCNPLAPHYECEID